MFHALCSIIQNHIKIYCSRYLGLPKTLFSAAKASTRSRTDERSGNEENIEEIAEEDPEDIKVIHFGIV